MARFSMPWPQAMPSGTSQFSLTGRKRRQQFAFAAIISIFLLVGQSAVAIAADPDTREQDRRASRVDSMVLKLSVHGIPFEEAHALGSGALPRLQLILGDSLKKRYWANATAMVGAIGTAKGFGILRDFISRDFDGEVDAETYWALTSALGVIGFTYEKGNADLLAMLQEGASPDWWARLPWKVANRKVEDVRGYLSRLSLHSLGYCQGSEAESVLVQLARDPRFTHRQEELRAVRALQAEVTRLGLLGYMHAQRGKHGF